jgi:hypothetical protein
LRNEFFFSAPQLKRGPLGTLRHGLTMLAILLALIITQDSVPGTYALIACTEQCAPTDTALVVARGILVLGSDHTGCFDVTRRDAYNSYIALHRHGYTAWSRPSGSDSLLFGTYRSPDAFHRVRAVLTDSGFVGRGHSSGAGVASINVPDELIVGRRIGPPDMERCPIYREDRRSRWAGPLIMVMATLGFGLAIMGSR